MSRPTVLLFDVDGTLITTGGVGRRAIERAFEVRYGRTDACGGFRFDGMTDRRIARQGLAAIGRPADDAEIDRLLVDYVAVLEDEVRNADAARYRLHAGMQSALDAARELPHVVVGLGTGNIEQGARIKLERVGVYERFAFGGFGSDDEDRPTLIRIGAERGAKLLWRSLTECRVVVIGDTPKDVEAAQSFGAESLGVGTGSFKADQLLGCGATFGFPDLAAPGALAALLGTPA